MCVKETARPKSAKHNQLQVTNYLLLRLEAFLTSPDSKSPQYIVHVWSKAKLTSNTMNSKSTIKKEEDKHDRRDQKPGWQTAAR